MLSRQALRLQLHQARERLHWKHMPRPTTPALTGGVGLLDEGRDAPLQGWEESLQQPHQAKQLSSGMHRHPSCWQRRTCSSLPKSLQLCKPNRDHSYAHPAEVRSTTLAARVCTSSLSSNTAPEFHQLT